MKKAKKIMSLLLLLCMVLSLAGCDGKAKRNSTSATIFNIESGSGGGTFTISSLTQVNPSVTISGNKHVEDGTYKGNRLSKNNWTVGISGRTAYATLQSDEITMLFHD